MVQYMSLSVEMNTVSINVFCNNQMKRNNFKLISAALNFNNNFLPEKNIYENV